MQTITISKDGNKFCAMIGENLQEGIAGFGNNIREALADLHFNLPDSNGIKKCHIGYDQVRELYKQLETIF